MNSAVFAFALSFLPYDTPCNIFSKMIPLRIKIFRYVSIRHFTNLKTNKN